jgi:hypothetical protein
VASEFQRPPNENIARFRKLIAIGEGDPDRDEVRHQMLLRLLAEEVATGEGPPTTLN